MEQTKQLHKIVRSTFFAKAFLAWTIFFVGLVTWIQPLDLPLTYVELYDQFVRDEYKQPWKVPASLPDAQLQQTVDDILQPTLHQAWDAWADDPFWLTMKERVCQNNQEYCQKIQYIGEWSHKQQYTYTALSVFFMAAIDNKIVLDNSLKETLTTLELRQSEGRARWLASHDKVYIHVPMIKSAKEFAKVLTHELWHTVDLGLIQGKNNSAFDPLFTEFGKLAFRIDDPSLAYYALSWDGETVRKSAGGEQNFCSWYGASNPFEDFAECFNAYLNHHQYMYVLAQSDPIINKKYQFFANLFDGDYIYSSSRDVATARTYIKTQKRPWDTTKLD